MHAHFGGAAASYEAESRPVQQKKAEDRRIFPLFSPMDGTTLDSVCSLTSEREQVLAKEELKHERR